MKNIIRLLTKPVLIPLLIGLIPSAFGETKEINLWVTRNVAPGPKIRVSINTRGIPEVNARLFPVKGSDWLQNGDLDNAPKPKIAGNAIKTWKVTLGKPDARPQSVQYYSKQIALPLTKPGTYLLEISNNGKSDWKVINVTNLAIVAKRSPTKALVWVTDAIKNQVVKDATVSLYRRGSLLKKSRTGPDGTCVIPCNPQTIEIVVSKGNDCAAVTSTGQIVDDVLTPHFQTDRPIYRPGNKIQYRVVLRATLGQGYKCLAQAPAYVEFRDPLDNVLEKADLTANANGTIAGNFEIPSEGMLGQYSIVVTARAQTKRHSVTVQEYRKPDFKVDVMPTQKRWLAGQEASFTVDSQYYFGAPVANAVVNYTIRRSRLSFYDWDDSDRYDDGNLYTPNDYYGDVLIASDATATDKNGKVVIPFKTDLKAPDSTYHIELSVKDSSNRIIEAGSTVPVYAAQLRLGLRTKVICAPLGSTIPVQVYATDLDGKPSAANVTLEVSKLVYVEKEKRNKAVVVTQTTVKVPPSGLTEVKLPVNVPDEMTIVATADDGTGRKTRSEMSVYVVSLNDKVVTETQAPSVKVRLGRGSYRLGDKISAYITTNRTKSPILATLEGGDVWEHIVIPPGKKTYVWQVPASAKISPNGEIQVFQWDQLESLQDNAAFNLPDLNRAIKVKVTPDRQDYRPGDKATYHVTTFDQANRPVSSEVSLSIVDEAIYALRQDTTQDLWRLYWGPRPSHVEMSLSCPEEVSGGAYQKNETDKKDKPLSGKQTVAPIRKRFEDTAYWNGWLETDADGKADVQIEMPGNLTTWRATARGMTQQTSVGTDRVMVKANRNVMLRLATPRQMVVGDQLRLIGTVDNRTNQTRSFKVSLDTKDIQVQGDAVQTIQIPAKSQGKIEWLLNADHLPPTGYAELLGEVTVPGTPESEADDYADAVLANLRIAPNGVEDRLVTGGTVGNQSEAELIVPEDTIPNVGKVNVTVWVGIKPFVDKILDDLWKQPLYGTIDASNQLQVAALRGFDGEDRVVLNLLAYLVKAQSVGGWGFWTGSLPNTIVTAQVVDALGFAKQSGIKPFESLLSKGSKDVVERYERAGIWEHKAILACALISASVDASKSLEEIRSKSELLSPYARLKLAQSYAMIANEATAKELVNGVLKDAVIDSAYAFVPCGDGVGWSATDTEATAQALITLLRLREQPELQTKLARWLVTSDGNTWRSDNERILIARALTQYLKVHPEAPSVGTVEIKIGEHQVSTKPDKIGSGVSAQVPVEWLKAGKNQLQLTRKGEGEALYKIEARVFRPGRYENSNGIQVMRRFEVQNSAGVWEEVAHPIRPSQTVRCTVVVWGDGVNDGVRVVEPIPSGFEFIEEEYLSSQEGQTEVRDAAVLHHLVNATSPQFFRFYLRSEAEAKLMVLPVWTEYIFRPSKRGQTTSTPLEVKDKK